VFDHTVDDVGVSPVVLPEIQLVRVLDDPAIEDVCFARWPVLSSDSFHIVFFS